MASYTTITKDDVLRILKEKEVLGIDDLVSCFLFSKYGSHIKCSIGPKTLTELVHFHNKLFFVANDVMFELWNEDKVKITLDRKWSLNEKTGV